MLRLPLEVRDLFIEWLQQHVPQRADRVLSLVRQMRGGADYRSSFGERMEGTGVYARLLHQRFELACRRLHLVQGRESLDAGRFAVPPVSGAQGSLF